MTRIMQTTLSPIPNREPVTHDELSPVSPLMLESVYLREERRNHFLATSMQAENLSIPRVSSAEVIRVRHDCGVDGKQYRFFQRQTQATTEIFPSDKGVEVAAFSGTRAGTRTPTFQRRGRFLVWPATLGQDQGFPLESSS